MSVCVADAAGRVIIISVLGAYECSCSSLYICRAECFRCVVSLGGARVLTAARKLHIRRDWNCPNFNFSSTAAVVAQLELVTSSCDDDDGNVLNVYCSAARWYCDWRERANTKVCIF